MRHITRFLLELGSGFAFVGRQVRLEVAGDEFFIHMPTPPLANHTAMSAKIAFFRGTWN
jgi:predicted nuclease of restriction endonuclease-like (RecB) superfamily